ncbi:MAG: OmpA family protein [Coxiellaceae bacterium]|nr:MAG: OmpA family protein [Coxiellaceae bacterium]
MYRVIGFIFTIVFAGLLSGCNPCNIIGKCPPYKPPPSPPPCGEIVDKLKLYGVQVIQVGDTLRIILPTDDYFRGTSTTELQPGRAPYLYKIATLLQCGCYEGYPVHVNGYTDEVGTPNQRRARARQRAQTIAAYLWADGIPLQRMQVAGYGAADALSSNETVVGSSNNRRVEITMPR